MPDNTINELFADDFPDGLLHVVDINTLITLKKSGNYEQTSQRLKGNTENCTDIELIKYKTREETINAIQSANPMDTYPELETTMAQLQNEQQKDTLLTTVKNWKTDGNIPDNNIYSTGDEQKYIKQLPRLIIDNGILKRNYYNHDGTTLYDQLCVPKHMLKEILYRIHNSPTGGHLGITRTIGEFRKRFYCPNYIKKIVDYIRNCSSCLQLKQIHLSRVKTPLQEISSTTSFPGDILHIDIMGAYPTTPYKYVLTAIDVLSKYLFAVPLTTMSASTVASALVSILFNHSYIPKEIMSDLGTQFVSELLHELTQLPEIKISHASLKHPQTIGVVERSPAAVARILKLNSNQSFTNWHKYVPLATFIHNTSYHTSIGCSPTVLFHGREPMKPLDLRFYSSCIQKAAFNYDFVDSLKDEMLKQFSKAKESLAKSFTRYRRYYDQKARANPLKEQTYCLLLNPKLTEQSAFSPKLIQKWLAMYRIEKVLTDFNYMIGKVGTNYTQIVHRIRTRPIIPQYQVDDIGDIDPENFQTDPLSDKYRGEQDYFDKGLPGLLE